MPTINSLITLSKEANATKKEINTNKELNNKIINFIKNRSLFHSFIGANTLKTEIKEVRLQDVLSSLCENLLQDDDFIANPLFYLDRLSELLSLDEPELKEIKKLATTIEQSIQYGDVLKNKKDILFFISLYSWKTQEFLLDILDNLILAFSITSLFKKGRNSYEAKHKIGSILNFIEEKKIIEKLLVFLRICNKKSPLASNYALYVLGILAILSLIHPYIKRVKHLPHGTCWDEATKNRTYSTWNVNSRKIILDEIANALQNHKYPLLLGVTGVGKTQIVESFAQAVQNGDYPSLSKKSFFYFNTANFARIEVGEEDEEEESIEAFGPPLVRIQNAVGKRSKSVILAFDEIHSICSVENNSMRNILKTILEGKDRDPFPFLIGMTTKEEYEETIAKDEALDRRFVKIDVLPTEKMETIQILRNTALQSGSISILAKGIYEYIFDKSGPGAQPMNSINLSLEFI